MGLSFFGCPIKIKLIKTKENNMEVKVSLPNGQEVVVNRHQVEYNYKSNEYYQRKDDSPEDANNWTTIVQAVDATRRHEGYQGLG